VLGLAALARDKLGPRLGHLRFASNGRLLRECVPPAPVTSTVPYGLAIAAASVITLITAKLKGHPCRPKQFSPCCS
jgi:hypothetical protein